MFEPPKDPLDERPFQAIASHRDLIHNVSFDFFGRRLATCSSDMTIAVWDRKPDGVWKRSAMWKVHGGAVWRAVWAHPEFGQILATCSYDRSISIWEEQFVRGDSSKGQKRKKTWLRRANINDSRANVTDVCFAPRHLGLLIAAVTAHGTIRIYEAADVMDISNWALIHELQAFHTRCGCVTWSISRMHRPLLAVGSDEKKSETNERIVVYENVDGLRKWQRLVTIKLDLPNPVTDLRFSPISLIDSHQLAIAAGDVHIFCIKVAKRAVLEDEDSNPVGENPVFCNEYCTQRVAVLGDAHKAWRVKYNITGSVLTSTSFDGTVRSWKSLFINEWVKMSDMSSEDYLRIPGEDDEEQGEKPPVETEYMTERLSDQIARTCF
ncbi:unnamed protein product [Caenorhabditis bovis]|uniref:Uncharacterized protein n=1 Tax=Caenorhabditis bovis TaxID=2654633 RepID=A0A8S1EMJ5_9PELO|nr:unnamed protein product [Caenorhabditis bovis]